ncbi:MAG: Gfo/Idh/MocA family oxidoreductase [Planctomycetota bacterium]|nr:Gfo/Idh/MocA family oxidoreductase [Planctomycetota bacterium]
MTAPRPGIALVGCGAIAASAHLPGIHPSPFELRAVCDMDRARVERFKQDQKLPGSVRVCASLDEVLALPGIDAVSVATPPASHAFLSIQALDAGKHVLCEKPSALSSRENWAICAAVERNPGRTIQFFSSRFRNGHARAARQYVREGRIGRPYRAEIQFWLPAARTCDRGGPPWFGQKALAGGGPFMDMGQYFLDRLFYILDWPRWHSVSAQAFTGFPTGYDAKVVYDVEDHMSLFARGDDGLVLTLDTTARVNQHWRWSSAIHGSEGSLVLDNTAEKKGVFLTDRDGVTVEEDLPVHEPGQDMQVRLEQLAAFMATGAPFELGTDARQALAISSFCEAAYRSASDGTEIEMEDAA